jgi:hypothetical protein
MSDPTYTTADLKPFKPQPRLTRITIESMRDTLNNNDQFASEEQRQAFLCAVIIASETAIRLKAQETFQLKTVRNKNRGVVTAPERTIQYLEVEEDDTDCYFPFQ